MNKDSIYQLIGYHGEYDVKVKKTLKKLLKDYHPDHGGDTKIFKLIMDVKKELETNKVSFNYHKKNNNAFKDIDYNYCEEMILKLNQRKRRITKEIAEKKKEILSLEKEYNNLYQQNQKNEKDLVDLSQYKDNFNMVKNKCILLIIFLFIAFIYSIFKKNIYILFIFFLLSLFLFWEIKKFFVNIKDINDKLKKQTGKYLKVFNNINENNLEKKQIEKELLEKEQMLRSINNDLRFYNNMIKHK